MVPKVILKMMTFAVKHEDDLQRFGLRIRYSFGQMKAVIFLLHRVFIELMRVSDVTISNNP